MTGQRCLALRLLLLRVFAQSCRLGLNALICNHVEVWIVVEPCGSSFPLRDVERSAERNVTFRCQAQGSADVRDHTVRQICAALIRSISVSERRWRRQGKYSDKTAESFVWRIHMQVFASDCRQSATPRSTTNVLRQCHAGHPPLRAIGFGSDEDGGAWAASVDGRCVRRWMSCSSEKDVRRGHGIEPRMPKARVLHFSSPEDLIGCICMRVLQKLTLFTTNLATLTCSVV